MCNQHAGKSWKKKRSNNTLMLFVVCFAVNHARLIMQNLLTTYICLKKRMVIR